MKWNFAATMSIQYEALQKSSNSKLTVDDGNPNSIVYKWVTSFVTEKEAPMQLLKAVVLKPLE